MVDSNNMDALAWLRKQLDGDENDLLREMVREFAQRLMAAEVDALTGAGWGEVSPERVNHRNGYRQRPFDTRVGSIELAIPKLRRGSYFPDWLLDPRRRAEKALVAVVAECYVRGVSTRRVDGLVKTLPPISSSRRTADQMRTTARSGLVLTTTSPARPRRWRTPWGTTTRDRPSTFTTVVTRSDRRRPRGSQWSGRAIPTTTADWPTTDASSGTRTRYPPPRRRTSWCHVLRVAAIGGGRQASQTPLPVPHTTPGAGRSRCSCRASDPKRKVGT